MSIDGMRRRVFTTLPILFGAGALLRGDGAEAQTTPKLPSCYDKGPGWSAGDKFARVDVRSSSAKVLERMEIFSGGSQRIRLKFSRFPKTNPPSVLVNVSFQLSSGKSYKFKEPVQVEKFKLSGDSASFEIALSTGVTKSFLKLLEGQSSLVFTLGGVNSNFKHVTASFDPDALRPLLRKASARRRELAKLSAAKGCRTPTGCFLTTACVEALGLRDDCWELRTLRRFRDRTMRATPEGRAMVAEYYAIAPEMAARLRARPDYLRISRNLYLRHVLPACVEARLGRSRQALARYRGMIAHLDEALDAV